MSVGSHFNGERVAAMYSLIGLAQLSRLDSEGYSRYVIKRVPDQSAHRVDELLPWSAAAHLLTPAKSAFIR